MKRHSIDELSQEERTAIEKSVLIEAALMENTILVDILGGERALNELRPYARMSGHAFTINMQKMFGIEGSDIERIADLSQLWESLTGNEEGVQEIERSSEKIIRAGFLKCPHQAARKEFCMWAHEMMMNGICEAINPDYECRFTQMITKGDPMCSYIIEKRKK